MLLDKIKKAGMNWATSPQAMKLMGNPNVRKALMRIIQLPGEIRAGVVDRTSKFAAYADLVTRNDMMELRRNLRRMQSDLERLRRQVREEQERLARAKAALGKTGGGNGDVTAPTVAEKPDAPSGKKKVKIGKRKVISKAKAAATEATATPTLAPAEAAPEADAPKKKKVIAKKKKVIAKKKKKSD